MVTSLRVLMILTVGAALSGAGAEPPATTTSPAQSPTFNVIRVQDETDYRRPDTERLLVTMRMTTDPATKLALTHSVLNAETATDDHGRSLAQTHVIPTNLNPDRVDPPDGQNSTQITLILKPPPVDGERAKMLTLLAGTIHAEQIVTKEALEFAVPGQTQKVYGDVTVTCKATMQSQTCIIQVGMTRPSNMNEEQWLIWQGRIRAVDPVVLDENGAKMNHNGSGSSWSSSSMSANFDFQVTGAKPAKASVTIVSQTKPIEIPYRLENVALP